MAQPERAGREGEQQLPVEGEGDILLSLAQTLPRELLARRTVGVKRYGRPLQAFNGRDACRDGREELLDALAYFEQERVERAELERQAGEGLVLLAAARAALEAKSAAYERAMTAADQARAEREEIALELGAALARLKQLVGETP